LQFDDAMLKSSGFVFFVNTSLQCTTIAVSLAHSVYTINFVTGIAYLDRN